MAQIHKKVHILNRKHRLGLGMKKISEKLDLAPDILEGSTILNMYGNQSALVENYKSIIEYSPTLVKLQGRHVKLLIEGANLTIERFTQEDCKILGNIQSVQVIPT